jgi:hypothetical protein
MSAPAHASPRRRRKAGASTQPVIDLDGDRLLTRAALSHLTGFSQKALRVMDCKGRGCRFLKLGSAKQSRVVYRLSDAQAWIASIAHEVGRPAISQT